MKIKSAKRPSQHLDGDSLRLMRLVEASRFVDVEHAARDMLARFDRHPLALRALTFALVGLRRFEDVLPVADFALLHYPADAEVRNNRAIALAELMRWEEAIPEFQASIRQLPDDYEIYKNIGVAYFRLHRWNDAVPVLLKAIELHPGDFVSAVELLAKALIYARRFDEAAVVCDSLYEELPDDPGSLERVVNVALHRCDWKELDAKLARLRHLLQNHETISNPWGFFKYWQTTMADYRRLAERFATWMIPEEIRKAQSLLPLDWHPGERKLRVGFLSSDLAVHPVGFLIAELIERLDRDALEVHAFAIGGDDGSEQRKRLVAAFDHFVDVNRLSVRETTDRIRASGIDILVDMNGWTGRSRAESLSLRCAPVQVSWLGYAGTMGLSSLADYVLGDPEVTPLSDQPFFTERIVQMPHSFMPVDTTQPIGPLPSRRDHGLPEDAFVLCSFNDHYKFNPPLFDLWCRILERLPKAILWLRKGSDVVVSHIREEAALRGIAPERLIFAERVEGRKDYLTRLQVADLALDTFPYGAHSTGADALLAGVPLITKRGDTFASRVGASLLMAVDMPELIAEDAAGYLGLVQELHDDRERLHALRQALVRGRSGEPRLPLFDMKQFAADMEARVFEMAAQAAEVSVPA